MTRTPLLGFNAQLDDAATWVARVRSGHMSATDQQRLHDWLATSRENRLEFDGLWQIVASTELSNDALTSPDILAMRAAAHSAPHQNHRYLWAAAACILLAVSGGIWMLRSNIVPVATQSVSFSTSIGMPARVALQDGTIVELDADSAARANITRTARNVVLEKGRAYFKVAKDAQHPFTVQTAGRTITALGTVFEVEVRADDILVTLYEGKVRVRSGTAGDSRNVEMDLTPGSQLISSNDAQWKIRNVNLDDAAGWLRGQIIFKNESLQNIVTTMNRYSANRIQIATAHVARQRMSGVVRAGDTATLVKAIEQMKIAAVVRTDDGNFMLGETSTE